MAKDLTRVCPACQQKKTYRADQKTCGCNGNSTVQAAQKPVEVEKDEQSGDERTITKLIDKRVRTLDELAEICEIDTSTWEIYKWRCVAWQTGMKNEKTGDSAFYTQQFSVSAHMRLRHDVIFANNEIAQLRLEAIGHVPAPAIIKLRDDAQQLIQEYSVVDHHFAALIWGKETRGPSWDNQIAVKAYDDAGDTLISRNSAFRAKRAVVVIGNDQQNVDNRLGTTEKGTPQSSDSRYQKMFSMSKSATIRFIEKLLCVHEEVHVVSCPGNHDYLATWHLADSIQSWFRENRRVTVDNSPAFRKYYQHGIVMLMWTHGNTGKLDKYDKTMAAEMPKMWGATRWREAHTGDKHQRQLLELVGAAVRILPSLRPPCAWSSENHLIGAVRAAESYTWHADEGLLNVATFSILDKETQ